jgi:hypothetical protein
MNDSLVKKEASFMEKWADGLDWLSKVFTNLALILGAYLAYVKFLKGRHYQVQLVPSLSCCIRSGEGVDKLHISAQITNVSSLWAEIPPQGFPVQVLVPVPDSDKANGAIKELDWEFETGVFLFVDQDSVQVGETLRDETILSVPKDFSGDFKVHLMVKYDGHKGSRRLLRIPDKGNIWHAVSIVSRDYLGDNQQTKTSEAEDFL